jgi:hypothetical protein
MPDDYHLYNPRQKRQFWAAHIEQWQRSDLSQSAYCRRHDLDRHRFFYWRRRIVKPKEMISFLPVALPVNEKALTVATSVRIHTPNGFAIELASQQSIDDLELIVAMVAGL